MGNDNIQLFEDQKIRTAWDEEKEEWYFSVVDVVAVLTESKDPAAYWRKLKQRLKEEGNETVTNCHGLKMTAADGKKRMTDVTTTEQLFRIIQGYSDEWIHQRILSIRVRNALTDEWQKSGVQQGREYAILTDEITKAWSGMSTRQYKNLKGLKKENLRDNMSDMELILNMLAESTSTEISKQQKPSTFAENMEVARSGGGAAADARKAVEVRTGTSVITSKNAAELNTVVTNVIEEIAEVGEEEKDDI